MLPPCLSVSPRSKKIPVVVTPAVQRSEGQALDRSSSRDNSYAKTKQKKGKKGRKDKKEKKGSYYARADRRGDKKQTQAPGGGSFGFRIETLV